MVIIDKMKEQYLELLQLSCPDKSIDEIKIYLDTVFETKLTDRNVLFNDGETKFPISLLEYTDRIEVEKPILSGYGASYKHHEEGSNILLTMVDHILVARKAIKKEMFKHVNDVDQTTYNNLDLMQKTYKLLANSFYGATIEKNSIFYDENFGPSITYTGVVIITTSIHAFEIFLSNNIHFEKLNDVLLYINRIQKEDYVYKDMIDKNITKKQLLAYIMTKYNNPTQAGVDTLAKLIKNLDQHTINKVFYKNNMYELFENEKFKEILSNVVGRNDFLDPTKPPVDMQQQLDLMWDYLKEWIMYNHLTFYRMKDAEERKRKTILLVDTDSNFLMLDPFYKFLKKTFPERVGTDDISRVSTINLATFTLSKVIMAVYEKLTKEMNVPEPKRPIVNMKNEFFYKRIMTTRNKKSYAGTLIMQEGHMYDRPKVDIKGLAIRKVSVNAHVRAYFTEMLNEQILKSDNINLGTVFGSFTKLEMDIKNSLKTGEVTYTLPGKANEIETYKTPYQMQPVRGTIVWNELYPEQEITLPTKINLLKLTIEGLEDIANVIPMREYEIIKRAIFDDENMSKYGFKVLALPKTLKTIPEWLIPFIDVDTMTNDHVKSGIIMLESLGFKTLDILTSQFPTNVLGF